MATSPTPKQVAASESDFGEALEQARPSLERVLARFRVPAVEAEDLLQNVAICFLRKQDEVLDPTRWLAGALRRECLKYWRTSRRRFTDAIDDGLLDLMEGPGMTFEQQFDLRLELRQALAALKARCRSVLYARYAEGYSDEETAHRLGYALASIDKVVRRCVQALSARLMQARALYPEGDR